MALTLWSGDLFEAGMQSLVNPVNTMGVSGAGLAKEFKRRFPMAVAEYEQEARCGLIEIGSVLTVPMAPNQYIHFFPTKNDWQYSSKPEYIDAGLSSLADHLHRLRIESVAIPALGCGLGELDFATVVFPLVRAHLGNLPVDVRLFMPR